MCGTLPTSVAAVGQRLFAPAPEPSLGLLEGLKKLLLLLSHTYGPNEGMHGTPNERHDDAVVTFDKR